MAACNQAHQDGLRLNEEHPNSNSSSYCPANSQNSSTIDSNCDHDSQQPKADVCPERCNVDWMAYNLDPYKAILVPILGAAIGLLTMNLVAHVHPLVNAVLFLGMVYIMRVVSMMPRPFELVVWVSRLGSSIRF